MDRMKMQTNNLADENFRQLSALFPNAVTEKKDPATGEIVRAIDADILRQEISGQVVEGREERYQFTWPDKKKAMLAANAPIAATLRPVREESVGKDGTPGGWDSQNLYIEGDNLDVLKLLQEAYLGKVKMIYIDPPYNTGNDFVYEDNFAEDAEEYLSRSGQFDSQGNRLELNTESNGRFHTDWLNMMYCRLKLARNLLTEDGVVFISIDDNEVDNLKKVCDEIFGCSNFVGILSVENNPKGRKNSAFISVSSEYCMIYARNKNMSYFVENVPKKASDMVLDENGRYVHNSGKRVLVGENSFNNPINGRNTEKDYSVYWYVKRVLRMTMRVNYIGVFRRGARLNLDKYYDRPFDAFDSYYEMFDGWLPSSWTDKLGLGRQMDWGSWLYVCDKKQMQKTVGSMVARVKPVIPAKEGEELATILPPIPLSEIPARNWYGILAVDID